MILYRNTYADGHQDFSVKPSDDAMINQAEAWELPKLITVKSIDEKREMFVYDYERRFLYDCEIWKDFSLLKTMELDGTLRPYLVFYAEFDECYKAYVFHKKGEPPRAPLEMKTTKTLCEHCHLEVSIPWNPKMFGYVLHCPYCGNPIYFCDQCPHRKYERYGHNITQYCIYD